MLTDLRSITIMVAFHAGADLQVASTIWLEKAREHKLKTVRSARQRAGLLVWRRTVNARGGANFREVLKRSSRDRQAMNRFMAWSDREWVLDGAAVRVSMVGF